MSCRSARQCPPATVVVCVLSESRYQDALDVLGLENVDPDELDEATQIVLDELDAMERKARASETCKRQVAELVFRAESKAAEIRQQGDPFESWHSWLGNPTPYLRSLVRRSCGVDP